MVENLGNIDVSKNSENFYFWPVLTKGQFLQKSAFKSTYFDSTNPSSSRTPTFENIANVSCEYATRSWKFEARVLGYVYGSS